MDEEQTTEEAVEKTTDKDYKFDDEKNAEKQSKNDVGSIESFGNPNLFQLINKVSSEKQGWAYTTKAMEITGVGCVIQTTIQRRNPDGSYAVSVAEALAFVPGVSIRGSGSNKKIYQT